MDALHGWAERYGRTLPVPRGDAAAGRAAMRAGRSVGAGARERSRGPGDGVGPGPGEDDGHRPGPSASAQTHTSRRRSGDVGAGADRGADPSPWCGRIDEAGRGVLRGWAFDARRPAQPVSLLVTLDGALLGRVVANRFRRDLAEAGIGAGRHGFELRFETSLSPLRAHQIRVLREEDGADLPRSPWVVEAASRLDEVDLDRLGGLLLEGLEADPALLRRRAGFLVQQLDRLLATGTDAPDAAGWRAARLGAGLSTCLDTRRDADGDTCGDTHRDTLAAAASPDAGPLALVVDEVMPDGTRDAGSNAILSHMRALRRLGYRVLFAAAEPVPDARLAAALSDAGIESCGAPFHASVEEVLRRHGAAARVVYLHRGSIGSRYARLARHHCARARLLLSVADLQDLRLARQARFERRDELLRLAGQARARELDAMTEVDAVLSHSAEEVEAIRRLLPGKPVHRALWTATATRVRTRFGARSGVAFLADYAHAPNLDAAHRLVGEIMPLVWEHQPDMPCLLAGSRLPHGFGGRDPRIRWIGHVPRLQDLFERVRLTVAPLAFGAGIKGKVLESLAAGVPCVCSPVAAEGLRLPGALRGLVSDSTHGIARLVLQLHADAALNRRAAAAGLAWATDALSETALDAVLGEACGLPPTGPRGGGPDRPA